MMNPIYWFERARELLQEFEPSRERSIAATKLDEMEMWLMKCRPTTEALKRDLRSQPPNKVREDAGLSHRPVEDDTTIVTKAVAAMMEEGASEADSVAVLHALNEAGIFLRYA